jgi:hypothetical protein
LSPNSFADLITIPHTGNIGDAHSVVVHYAGAVGVSMIGGHWVSLSNL